MVERPEAEVGVHHATQQRIGQPRFVRQLRERRHRVEDRHVVNGSRRFQDHEWLGIVEEGRDAHIGLAPQGEDRAESLGGRRPLRSIDQRLHVGRVDEADHGRMPQRRVGIRILSEQLKQRPDRRFVLHAPQGQRGEGFHPLAVIL